MEKILDCSSMSDFEFEAVKRGLEDMDKKDCARYFGYVDKTILKDLVKCFEYKDRKAFFKGGLFATGVIVAGAFAKRLIEKKLAEKEKEEEES